ncbi:tlc domain-containing protein [Quercus suber]|uniref:Tlc domain-containing protein n=1 Tax=Quercus suber TaxID=58331 RepID=A0AAW0LDX8_QUESU
METLLNFTPAFPTFFLMFLLAYLFAFFVVFRNWSPKQKPEASSCLMSLTHGTPAVIMSTRALMNSPTPLSFASPNASFQNFVLEFSIAYFLMDLLHYMVFVPNDLLFIGHHLATLYVFVTCRYVVHHGAVAILVLLFLAEVTSACQNVRSIANLRRADVPLAAKVGGANNLIPRWAWISWMVVIVVAVMISILWVSNLWIFWFRQRSHRAQKKVK